MQLGYEGDNNFQVIPVIKKVDSSSLKVFNTYLIKVETRTSEDRQTLITHIAHQCYTQERWENLCTEYLKINNGEKWSHIRRET